MGSFQHVAYARLAAAPGDISRLSLDADGFLWMKAARGSARFDGEAFQSFSTVPGFLEHDPVARDTDGNVWSVMQGELWLTVRGSQTMQRVAGMPPGLQEVVVGGRGRLYLRSDRGVYFFRREGTSLRAIAAPIDDRQANGLMESRSGALWITRTSAVIHASAEALDAAEREGRAPTTDVFGRSQGLTGAFPHPMIEDTAGNVWVGSEGGLDLFRRTAFTAVALPEGIHQINAETDSRGTTWVGSDNMPILRIDATGTRSTLAGTGPTFAMVRDSGRDVVWAASDRGVWRLDKAGATLTGRITFADAAEAAGPLEAGSSAADSRGVVWLGLARAPALVRLEKGQISIAGAAQGLATGPIKAMAVDGGGVWVGGDNGVQFYDGARFRAVPTGTPDLLRWVTGIVLDKAGHLWVATSALVFRSRDVAASNGASHRTIPWQFDRFDYIDGIPGGADPDRGLPSLRMSEDGRVWAKTVAGLAWIDPSRLPGPRAPAVPRIERIDVHGVVRTTTRGRVELGPRERDVAIRYTVAELSRPDQIRFQYRLRPASDTWTDAGVSREVFLTQLPPGSSVFEVRAVMGGVAPAAAAELHIDRKAAFEETVAFKAVLILACIALVVLLAALRLRVMTRRLRIRAQEREAIARDIHDTLLQRLQGAMLAMQSLANRQAIPVHERRDIARVAEETKDAIVAGRDRIQGLRGGADASVALYDRILAEGQRLSSRHGATCAITLSGAPRPLREKAAAQLSAIALEAMTNAFVHAHGTRVEVSIAYEKNGLWLVVADDGQGFDADALNQAAGTGHVGLRGMRERALTLSGTLRIESAPGEGTEIHVFVPRRRVFG